MSAPQRPERLKWFFGETEINHGEYGWDGKIWEPPSPAEIAAAEADCGVIPEPYEIASELSPEDAALLRAAPHLLASVLELRANLVCRVALTDEECCLLKKADAAIALTKETPKP